MRTKFRIILLGIVISASLSSQIQPGDKAVDFTLRNVDNKLVSLSDYYENNGVILIFTCNPCPFAKAYEQRMIRIHNFYAPKGYPVIAINPNDEALSPDDSFKKMQDLAKENNYPFPYLKDETQEIYKAYGATRTPQIFLLYNEGGQLRLAYSGAIDNNVVDPKGVTERYLEKAIASLIKGETPDPDWVRAVGCMIKTGSRREE